MRSLTTAVTLVCALALAGTAAATEVIFLNGDRLTGKIVSAAGGKLILKTERAGDVTIDLSKVKTFSTDEPVDLRVGVEVAGLNFRVTPSSGLGYRWFEGPTFNFSTEAGIAYVYEDYETSGVNQFWAPRLAYVVDWTPVERLKLYNTLEYLPAFDAFTENYLLNINAGLRATLWKGPFTDVPIEYRYDNEPAPGRKKADTRYILGNGWEF
jgi:hypothetical protein